MASLGPPPSWLRPQMSRSASSSEESERGAAAQFGCSRPGSTCSVQFSLIRFGSKTQSSRAASEQEAAAARSNFKQWLQADRKREPRGAPELLVPVLVPEPEPARSGSRCCSGLEETRFRSRMEAAGASCFWTGNRTEPRRL